MAQVPARCRFTALGTTAELLVTDPARLRQAEQILRDGLRQLDLACSRFRTDSEISEVHARAGVAVPISALLVRALDTALRAGELTGGLVDPTVGRAVRTLGYDRDFTALGLDDPEPAPATVAVPGWQRVRLDRRSATVLFPHGVEVDLGATAKALGADLAAARIAKMTGCGVLVGLGGDIAVAGKPPAGGWQVSIGEDHAHPNSVEDPVVRIDSGGLATSSTTCRTWHRGGRSVHHIVDPRTGGPAEPVWRSVSVAAASCVDANIASTAAIVLGLKAPSWLRELGLPARLLAKDGTANTVAAWPEEDLAEPRPMVGSR